MARPWAATLAVVLAAVPVTFVSAATQSSTGSLWQAVVVAAVRRGAKRLRRAVWAASVEGVPESPGLMLPRSGVMLAVALAVPVVLAVRLELVAVAFWELSGKPTARAVQGKLAAALAPHASPAVVAVVAVQSSEVAEVVVPLVQRLAPEMTKGQAAAAVVVLRRPPA